jgi:hypothetical protein
MWKRNKSLMRSNLGGNLANSPVADETNHPPSPFGAPSGALSESRAAQSTATKRHLVYSFSESFPPSSSAVLETLRSCSKILIEVQSSLRLSETADVCHT